MEKIKGVRLFNKFSTREKIYVAMLLSSIIIIWNFKYISGIIHPVTCCVIVLYTIINSLVNHLLEIKKIKKLNEEIIRENKGWYIKMNRTIKIKKIYEKIRSKESK